LSVGFLKASRYFYEIKDVPRYPVRLRTCIFKGEFQEKLDSAMKDALLIEKACLALKNNEKFKTFLKIILDVGNKMNSVGKIK
jgi:hypothetical protein